MMGDDDGPPVRREPGRLMTPFEIYGHGQEFGQISRNNQQLFTTQALAAGKAY